VVLHEIELPTHSISYVYVQREREREREREEGRESVIIFVSQNSGASNWRLNERCSLFSLNPRADVPHLKVPSIIPRCGVTGVAY